MLPCFRRRTPHGLPVRADATARPRIGWGGRPLGLVLTLLSVVLAPSGRGGAAPIPTPGGPARVLEVRVPAASGVPVTGGRVISVVIPEGYEAIAAHPTHGAAPARVELLGQSRARGIELAQLRLDADAPDDLAVELELAVVAPDPGDLRPIRMDAPGERSFRNQLRAQVVNPEAIAIVPSEPSRASARPRLTPSTFSGSETNARYRPTVDGSPVAMVIITSSALEAEYTRLAEWRTRTGEYTVIRNVTWIAETYPEGVDLQDSIRRFIRDAVTYWGVEWVLLGGDSDVIPPRYGHTGYFGGEDIPADIYFQCLDGTWNANGNGVFGEGLLGTQAGTSPGDDCDLDPEVWVARIPLSTTAGVRSVINKIFQHERTPPTNRAYIPSFLCLAEMLQPIDWEPGDLVLFDGAELGESAVANLPSSFRVTRMYENHTDPRWASIAVPEVKEAVLDSMNAGYSIVHHVGHGFRNNVSVGLGGKEIERTDAAGLTNSAEPFLWYGINCNSASFDFDCIAEYFLSNPVGGAFAYIGSTRFDFPGHSEDYTGLFYRNLFAGIPEIGKALALSKRPRIFEARYDGADRWTQFALICLGDPLTRIRSENPRTLSVSHPVTTTLGGDVAVTVSRNGAPLQGARVTLFRAGDLFVTGLTDAAGAVTLSCPANDAGPISLTATDVNSIPYEGIVTLTSPAVAHLKVTGLVVRDNVTASGNNDGHLDPGETADLLFTIQNNGGLSAANVTLTYAPEGTLLDVVTPTASLGSIGLGESRSAPLGDAIRVTAASTIAGPTSIAGGLTLTSDGGSRVDPVVVQVGGIDLWIDQQVFVDDPGGAGSNGVVAGGELVHLTPTLRNRGLSVAGDVRVRLESIDSGVTISVGEQSLGELPGGGVAAPAAPLQFSVTDPALIASVELVVRVEGQEVQRHALDLSPPGAPGTPVSTPGPTSITLTWAAPVAPDLRGYVIYRSGAAAGPFVRINGLADSPMSFYEDAGLGGFTTYFYQVAAQDVAGNEGPRSGVVEVTTSFAALLNFPLEREAGTPASPTLHDLDGDGRPEIIIGGEEIYAIHADGTEYFDGDGDSRTLGTLSQTDRATFWGTPAVADVDHDGVLEIVAAGWKSGLLYVFSTEGSIQPGWPRKLADQDPGNGVSYLWASPCVVDIDDDDDLEIFIPGDRWLYGFHHDGTEIRDGDNNPATIGRFADLGGGFNYGTPAAVDLDHDNRPEIVIGTRVTRQVHAYTANGTELAGFPRTMEGSIQSSVALADLDGDDEIEIVVAVHQPRNRVEAFNRFGVSPPGWPVGILVNQDLDASPTIGDLDGDEKPEVVMMGGSGKVQAWHGHNGQALFAPVDLGALENDQSFAARGTPTLGDITGDGRPDILVGTQTGTLYGIDAQGNVLPGFPLRAIDSIEGGALIWDIDGDLKNEILFASVDKNVYAYFTPGVFSGTALPWPMFRRDQTNSGAHAPDVPIPAEPTLASFSASSVAGGVRLEWRAPTPVARWTGWAVLRSRGEDVFERIDAGLVPGTAGIHVFDDRDVVPGTTYRYALEGVDRSGGRTRFAPLSFLVPDGGARTALLRQNVPNPFRDATSVHYRVPGDGESAADSPRGVPAVSAVEDGAAVRLTIFDLQGRAVRRLVDRLQPAGEYSISWDSRNDAGERQPTGVYFYRLEVGDQIETRKMILAP